MRGLLTLLLVSGMAWGQASETPKAPDNSAPDAAATQNTESTTAPASGASSATNVPAQAAQTAASVDPNALAIPAGTKIPLLLKQAISTKNARDGDAVYAETAFPFVLNDRILVPAGTYIQGKISHVERAGHGHGRAEILMHFTSMIYPSGYTVMLPGSVENTPGAEHNTVKDSEGTIRQDSETGKKIEDAAKNGTYGTIGGATAGGLATGSLNGARVGAGVGAAAGVAWALLKRGADVRLDVGTSIEMEIQREVPLDANRIMVAKAGS